MLKAIRGWHSYHLLKFVQVSTLLTLPFALYALVSNFTWLYLLVTLVSILLISKVGHSIGQHRYFSHRSFKTGPKREWLMALFATLGTTHTAIHYSALHRYHHAHSDTELDPHCPRQLGFFRSFFSFIDQEKTKEIKTRLVKDLLANDTVVFFHNWYWPTIALYWIILVSIDPLLFLFCYVIPCGYVQFVAGTQLSLGHMWGYRNFDTKDSSINNRLWNWLTLGEGLHNNHHQKPYEYDFAFTKKPGEWDFCGWLVKRFLVQ